MKMNFQTARNGGIIFNPRVICFLVLWAHLLSGCNATEPTHSVALACEGVGIVLEEDEWQLASQHRETSMVDSEWHIPNAGSTSWSESLRLAAFNHRESKLPPPMEVMEGLRGLLRAQCPSLVWNVIELNEYDVVYESSFTVCRGHPPRHQIVRIFDGPVNRYKLTYQARLSNLPSRKRSAWIDRFKKAKPKRVDCGD